MNQSVSVSLEDRKGSVAGFQSTGIARNAIYNALGGILPSFIAILAVPFLIRALGTERFGVLTLLWMVLSYFTIFDLGGGRAITKSVSDCLARSDFVQLSPMVWTAWIFLLGLGTVGGVLWFVLTPYLVEQVLKVPSSLLAETRGAFYAMAFSIPLLIISLGLRGVLEGESRFDLANLVSVPNRIAHYVIPLVFALFSPRLDVVAGGLLVIQLLTCVVYWGLCLHSLPQLWAIRKLDMQYVKPLVEFGGWLTVSSVVSPVMQYFDSFFIGSLISVAAVAYYTTPYEALSKLLIFPLALTSVLFPVFSGLIASQNCTQGREMLLRSVELLIFLMTPLVIILVVLAEEILGLWVGAEFARQSALVFKLLAFGLLFWNALGRLLTNWIHAHGRSDITAKFHLLELPLYLGGLWLLLQTQGINGAAAASLLRMALDTLLLFWFSVRLLTEGRVLFVRRIALLFVIGIGTYLMAEGLVTFTSVLWMRILMVLGIVGGYGLLVWGKLLNVYEKQLLTVIGKRLFHRFGILWESS